jgi:cell wall-associated NlpC family hydrolase
MNLNKYIQVPFLEKGRSKEGWDCWGLAFVIYKDVLGIHLPLYIEDYVSTGQKDLLGNLITEEKRKWQQVDQPQKFDLMIIRLRGRPMHIGLYLGGGKFIQALEKSGTVIERVDSIAWKNRILGYYRYVS